jgi:hypothetical protein
VFKDDYTNTRIINSLNDENQMQNFMTTDLSSDGWQGRQKIVPGEGRPQLVDRLDPVEGPAAAGWPFELAGLQDPDAQRLRTRRL